MPDLVPGRVTIGIPTWNRRARLQTAVESALNQTYKNLEIVISDDGSADDTAQYIESISDPRVVKLLKSENNGLVANYNACLKAASSEFFLMLNDDDTLLPSAIEKLVSSFLNPPNTVRSDQVGISWCPFVNVDPNGNDLWVVRGGPPLESSIDLLEGLFTGTRGPLCSGIMFRTSDALAVGGYDPRFWSGCEDSDLWGKVALLREYAACVNEPLMRYLLHPASGATANAQCVVWQDAKQMEITDFLTMLEQRGDPAGAERLRRAGDQTLANTTLTVLLRSVGKPGWIREWAAEFWRSRRFMLTPFVLKRAVKDGWKLLRLRKQSSTGQSDLKTRKDRRMYPLLH